MRKIIAVITGFFIWGGTSAHSLQTMPVHADPWLTTSIPEPAAFLLLGIGMMGLATMCRRQLKG